MRYLVIFSFLLSAANVMACECFIVRIKTKEDLKKYDFVAVVKVEETAPENDKLLWVNGDMKIHVDELFKGNLMTAINIADFGFPCSQELPKKGERLLVFGYMRDGKMLTHTCSFFRVVDNKLPTYAVVDSVESLRRIATER